MALRKFEPSNDPTSVNIAPSKISRKTHEKAKFTGPELTADAPMEPDVEIDLREVYFLIMHFLSAGPCHRTYGQFWNELLEHQLLPRRYHAWYSRSGTRSGDEDDNGFSLPLSYNKLVERYPHVEKDHLVKLLKQLMVRSAPSHGTEGGMTPSAADVPTLLGSGSFSLLNSDRRVVEDTTIGQVPGYLRWPHIQADQVHGLSLREIGGGFTRHHRAPSVRAASYAIAKPSTMLQKMQTIKALRGHQNAVYCAIFDRTGRYVITGSDDRLVKIWSMETAFCLASCRGHEGDITDLAVSFNNTLVASASNDCNIRVWRLPDGLPISVLRGHTSAVTAIAFSPRPSAVYQLLSSSDDGTCRIWDARYSQSSPRIYIPKPPDDVAGAGKSNDPASITGQRSHQILCCAYNANGTVFVTGSSDTYARVWNAYKCNPEESEQPNHEMDVLSGHENDVNYVQFSGCAVATRSSTTDTLKEENIPKFKNSWFTHDNIVTCSRDGSAIIWTPRSRRSHGKVGRWSRAYHLKVPPPPMPPQQPRGGPRQRLLPTPRGVNMIVWSLDNRFVLAAIMDCRICVWNAVDGSLVHSLTGHSESTYVLDVHPFNPRIAMSAGYDGKTIVWDIWEGQPVRTYEIGRFKLVDGKFSPDGTSIVLSDEVGQIHVLATGQGESQKDAKYDQFFLGDYRPLIHDIHGNVLDQETQLSSYRRNMQDLLCDSSMIPYPDAYQNMYQQRRLGALGIEWRPPSIKLAVGSADNIPQVYQVLPLHHGDLDRWLEPLPDFIDAMDWEQENDVQSDDNDSEYNVAEEYSSDGAHGSLSVSSSGDLESNTEDSDNDDSSKEYLRRSKRRKHKAEVEFLTSSGRRVKRRNLDERDGTLIRSNRGKKSRNGRLSSRKKSSKSNRSRPQRVAARNARTFLSRLSGASTDGEVDEYDSGSESSDSESMPPDSNVLSKESNRSMQTLQSKRPREKEAASDELANGIKPCGDPETQTNAGNRKRLVLKFQVRDSKKVLPLENFKSDSHVEGNVMDSPDEAPLETRKLKQSISSSQEHGTDAEASNSREGKKEEKIEGHPDLSLGYKDNEIRWGEVKARTSKRSRFGDAQATEVDVIENNIEGHPESVYYLKDPQFRSSSLEGLDDARNKEDVQEFAQNSLVDERLSSISPVKCSGEESSVACKADGFGYGGSDESLEVVGRLNNSNRCLGVDKSNGGTGVSMKLRIRSRRTTEDLQNPSSKLKSVAVPEDSKSSDCEQNHISEIAEEEGISSGPVLNHEDWNNGSKLENQSDKNSRVSTLHHSDGSNKMFNVVYKRSKSYKVKTDSEGDAKGMDESASNIDNHSVDPNMDFLTVNGGAQRTRSMGTKASGMDPVVGDFKNRERHNYAETSKSAEKFSLDTREQLLCEQWKTSSRVTVGLRSARIKREHFYHSDLGSLDKRKTRPSARKVSWLMLSEHEKGYRYIPQMGDEVAYLRQGHQEFLEQSYSHDVGPWRSIKGNIKSVEFCSVQGLDYSSLPGSGESCCKLTLGFIDPSSEIYGKSFKMTLSELTDFPDFLVERTRFDAAINRNWTHRDKCQVWWRNSSEEGGSWWEGRIISVKPKSSDFPDSPWERYVIQYKGDTGQHQHSPWELHDPDSPIWEHPHIDLHSRSKLLSSFWKIGQMAYRNQDYYGVDKLKQVAQKSDFLNRFPVPLSLEVIENRLENNYYRSMKAIKHDVEVMLSNAQTYFAKRAEFVVKMRHLSEWMERILPSS